MRHALLALSTIALVAACGQKAADPAPATPSETPAKAPVDAPAPAATDVSLQSVLDANLRSADEKQRDAWRHPAETLEFFGIEADDKVVEAWPGGGWYSNILVPYLSSGGGTFVAANWDPGAYEGERRAGIEGRIATYKDTYAAFDNVEHSAFSGVSGPLTEDGSADAVLTFRNIHNWMSGGYTEKFFTDAFLALKPGGVLGVVEHRLPSTGVQDPKGSSGYVHEDYVISLAEAAGFELVERSDINANPADTADHPFGVWTLPPNSRTEDREGNTPDGFDAAVYSAVGESDRMTLKFVKPGG